MDLDDAAVVEVTSEEKEYPVESALVSGEMRGWRAADSGTQTIRLIFDEPQRLTRIALVFEETETERTQEFVLRWSPDGGRSFREIVRQQWNFSPPKTIREIEECQVDRMRQRKYMLDKRMGCESLDSLNSATVKRLASYVFGCIAVRLRIYVGQQQFVGTALAATGFMEQPGAVACQLVRLSTL